jgi:hypothetical protein
MRRWKSRNKRRGSSPPAPMADVAASDGTSSTSEGSGEWRGRGSGGERGEGARASPCQHRARGMWQRAGAHGGHVHNTR